MERGAAAEEEGMALSEALTADSADDEGRRGSSSSATSEVASTESSYSQPDEWQRVAIKTCVLADVVTAGTAGKEKHGASGTRVATILRLIRGTCT